MATAIKRKPVTKKAVAAAPAKVEKGYRPMIRSRHPSHDVLRTALPRMPFRSIVRFGSVTVVEDGRDRVELNNPEAIRNSASKIRMKNCFARDGVKTASWFTIRDKNLYMEGKGKATPLSDLSSADFPIVAKSEFGSRGEGNTLLNDRTQLLTFIKNHNLANYIFEKYYNYNREYRLHVTAEGCFYTNRKMLKSDTPEKDRWFRNDSNSVWIREENEQFDKPVNWDAIVEECVKALNSVGLDFGAVDLRVQSAKNSEGKNRKNPDFIVVEINSAPSFGEITTEKYLEMLPTLLTNKAKKK